MQAKDIGWCKKIGQSFNPSGIAMFGRVLQVCWSQQYWVWFCPSDAVPMLAALADIP